MYKLGYNTGGKYGYCNNKFITKNVKQIFLLNAVIFSIGLLTMPIEDAIAGGPPTIAWQFPGGITINQGDANGLTFPIIFTVTDPSLIGNGIDTIDVLMTSSAGGSTTLTLTETVDDGTFTNTNLILTHGPAEFKDIDTITITIEDDCSFGHGNCDPNSIDMLTGAIDGVFVGSNTDPLPGGIFLDLTETGIDTDIFTRTLQFSTVGPSDSNTATLHVTPGDVITIVDVTTGAWTNGLITPSPGDVGSIPAETLGTVTASYGGVSEQVNILDDGAPGRGSGGLLRPGLVLNFAASLSSTSRCSGDCTNPTLGLDADSNRIVDKGFSYNGIAEDVMDFYTPYPLITTEVGKENVAVLKIYENSGPQNIKHVSLAFGLSHGGESISQSKAIINWDRTFFGYETVTVKDPENALQDISIETTTGSCSANTETQCLILTIYHTFREYLGFNIVGTDVWDSKLNSETNFYNDGVEVVGESMNPPKQYNVMDSRGYSALITQTDKDRGLDEEGNSWTMINNIWLKDYITQEKIPDSLNSHGIDRTSNIFKTYFDGQTLLAEELLNQQLFGKSIQNPNFANGDNYVSLPSNFNEDEFEKQLQKRILNEQTRAEELFCTLYKIKHHCHG